MTTTKVSSYGVDLYKVKINDGGTVEFDVGTGSVLVNGDLNVIGATTSIESSELVIADNTITVNSGETGAGVTLGTAGLIVDRGSAPDAKLLFDESRDWLDSQTGGIVTGAFTFINQAGDLVGVYTNSINTLGNDDLILLNEGTSAIVRVATARPIPYERTIWNYDSNDIFYSPLTVDRLDEPADDGALVNARGLIDYVRSYLLYNFQQKISAPKPEGNTEVQVYDTAGGDPVSRAVVRVDGVEIITVSSTNTIIDRVSIIDNILSSNTPGENLIITASGSGYVEVQNALALTKITEPPQPVNGTKLYAQDEADGGTGIYFVNELGTRDELISKSKALLYSIIF